MSEADEVKPEEDEFLDEEAKKLHDAKKKLKEQDDEEDIDFEPDEEDIKEYLNKLFEKKTEGLTMVRVFREVEIQTPNPVPTPPMADNPKGNVPGEDKYVEKAYFEERMGRVEEGIRKVGDEVSKMRKEGAGETRGTDEPAGPEAPRPMDIGAEKLSKRQTIIGGGIHKERFDVKNAVKEFLKSQGGVM